RNLHLAVPDARGLVDAGLHLEAGVPGHALLGRRVGAIDVEVHPLAAGRDLELPVAPDVTGVPAYDGLGHVPVPEARRLARHVSLGFQVECVEGAGVEQVEMRARPARANLGGASGDG